MERDRRCRAPRSDRHAVDRDNRGGVSSSGRDGHAADAWAHRGAVVGRGRCEGGIERAAAQRQAAQTRIARCAHGCASDSDGGSLCRNANFGSDDDGDRVRAHAQGYGSRGAAGGNGHTVHRDGCARVGHGWREGQAADTIRHHGAVAGGSWCEGRIERAAAQRQAAQVNIARYRRAEY